MPFVMKLTAVGAAKIAAATAGDPVALTEMAAGDGDGAPVAAPDGSETALANEVWRDTLSALSVSLVDPEVMIAEAVIGIADGPFTVREIGVFDAEGDLFAYGNFPETYKPDPVEGSAREMLIRVSIRVTTAENVTILIDESAVFATQAWSNGRFLQIAANLADVEDAAEARDNLGAAPLASPVFTGDPRAPTPDAADNDTTVTNTAWTRAYVAAALAANPKATVQTFAGSGTWNKPANSSFVMVLLLAGGGGGGSGRRGAAASTRLGGSGGGGGCWITQTFAAADLPASVTVTVGAGGNGGAARTVNTTTGAAGSDGGNSSFGTHLLALGGKGGGGGIGANSAVWGGDGGALISGVPGQTAVIGGTSGQSGTNLNSNIRQEPWGGVCGGGVNNETDVLRGGYCSFGGHGGGGGGCITAANGLTAGGDGAALSNLGIAGVKGDAGTVGSRNGTAGTGRGSGGGGYPGDTAGTTPGGSGGNGSIGCGGGGGGASTNGANSGAGGRGGDGLCIVISW